MSQIALQVFVGAYDTCEVLARGDVLDGSTTSFPRLIWSSTLSQACCAEMQCWCTPVVSAFANSVPVNGRLPISSPSLELRNFATRAIPPRYAVGDASTADTNPIPPFLSGALS